MSEQGLAVWLSRLEQLHPKEIELGLDRVASVAARMGIDCPGARVVTVAGTNGKGTTVAALDALLTHAGLLTGIYTSPHFTHFNERIRIGGELATDQEIVASFERIDAARDDISLTYFEFATLAALDIFDRATLDVLILEVGLGGRLDAVNIIDPDVAVITAIDLDHQDWLGNDREQIALEKAGILRENCQFICADLTPTDSLRGRVSELGCKAHWIDQQEADALSVPGLRGENIAAAVRVAQCLGQEFSPEATAQALTNIQLSGRVQRLELDGVQIVLDVAHNPAAARHLAAELRREPVDGRTAAVFAALSDKDIHAMIRPVLDLVDAWFVCALPGVNRAQGKGELADALREQGAHMVSESDNVRQAYRRARSLLGAGDRLIVFGSFHTVGGVMPSVEKEQKKLE